MDVGNLIDKKIERVENTTNCPYVEWNILFGVFIYKTKLINK